MALSKSLKVGKKQYTDRDKAAALTLLDFNSGNLNKTAKALEIPESTLRKWQADRIEEKSLIFEAVEEFQGELSEKFENTIGIGLKRANELLPKARLDDVRRFLEMMTDKLQLLNNRPTAIQGLVTNENKTEKVLTIFGQAYERREKAQNPESNDS